ncbi:MAG: L-2-hydroxyglutarate oxidase [Lentisphaerae bacterium]|nr:L-2-hydroxyglutarate oxidase [Lentisphaerota bacterium]
MDDVRFDFAVIGGGIVGLATAQALAAQRPGRRVVVIEKEGHVAAHQTGHNSGVIHSGIYYKPGSLKARLCREGSTRLVAFCRTHGLPHDICGKVIVATQVSELERLDALFLRGQANGIPVRRIDPAELREIEPHVQGVGAVHVAATGIVDFKAVCRQLAQLVEAGGGKILLNAPATAFRHSGEGWTIQTGSAGDVRARFLINCAGLHSDRVARLCGAQVDAQIVPFRGEYYELVPERRGLVKGLIYPVPNPAFPFLGVHYTRMIDGSVHAGPNAVLSLRREGYRKTDVLLGDVLEVMAFGGFWRLARKNIGEGWKEIVRSFSKAAFTRSLQALIPEVRAEDLVTTHAGVRAQALRPDGSLVDDFLIVHGPDSLHVCNAPSPAATSALAIGCEIVGMLPGRG